MSDRESIVAWLEKQAGELRAMSRTKEYGLASRAKWEAEAKLITLLSTQIRRKHDQKMEAR